MYYFFSLLFSLFSSKASQFEELSLLYVPSLCSLLKLNKINRDNNRTTMPFRTEINGEWEIWREKKKTKKWKSDHLLGSHVCHVYRNSHNRLQSAMVLVAVIVGSFCDRFHNYKRIRKFFFHSFKFHNWVLTGESWKFVAFDKRNVHNAHFYSHSKLFLLPRKFHIDGNGYNNNNQLFVMVKTIDNVAMTTDRDLK